MQDRHLYEYAVIRVVPKVEREEFLNVGVVIFCKKEKFLKVAYQLHHEKLAILDKDLDLEQLENNMRSFERICKGEKSGGPIAQMDAASRFRWLTAVRSSVIQTSRPHPGFCNDGSLDLTLQKLFGDLVL